MQRSLLVAALLVLAATSFALPAAAGRPDQASASATIAVAGPCSFLVTYTWSGFSGTGLQALVGLASKEAGGANFIFGRKYLLDQAGAGGSVSATFTLTGALPSTHSFYSYGQLFKIGGRVSTVKGSYTESSVLPPETCGEEVAIS